MPDDVLGVAPHLLAANHVVVRVQTIVIPSFVGRHVLPEEICRRVGIGMTFDLCSDLVSVLNWHVVHAFGAPYQQNTIIT